MSYILLSNDDGVDAPGLLALKHALQKIAEVRVIAPDRNWSAAGHAKTMHRPLRVRPVKLRDGSEAFSSDGAPSDCVTFALLGFFSERPALVVSGINPFANIGKDILYSGTVAAAMEAALDGVPAIATSTEPVNDVQDYAAAAEYASRLARRVLREGMPPDTVLNLNAMSLPLNAIRGVKITRAGKRIYYDRLIKREDPAGRPYYWIGGDRPGGDKEQIGTDVWALANNFVSITPVHIDMTNHALIDSLQAWASELEAAQ